MKKNTLLVLAIILIPIIIVGCLAMAGAGNYAHDDGSTEGENNEENATEGATILVPVEATDMVSPPLDVVIFESKFFS